MKSVLLFLAMTAAPDAPRPECTPSLHLVQGQEVYCCTIDSGQQCCASTLNDDGKPSDCKC